MTFQIVQMIDDRLVSTICEDIAAIELRGYPLMPGRVGGSHLRAELRGQPCFKGLAGPMWGGEFNGAPLVRYEDAEACDFLSR